MTLIALRNRLECGSHNRVERALFESQFLQRKNGRAATAAVIAYSFKVYRRLIYMRVPFRVKRGLGKQISFIEAYRPQHYYLLALLNAFAASVMACLPWSNIPANDKNG